MTILTTKYVRKPLYVDATRVTTENFVEIAKWCQGEIRSRDGDKPVTDDNPNPNTTYIHVRVHNPKVPRQTMAFPGDWILYTNRGYKVYTQRAFDAQFDPAEAAEAAEAADKPEQTQAA